MKAKGNKKRSLFKYLLSIKVLFISALDAAEEILSMFPEVKPSSIIRKPVSQEYLLRRYKKLSLVPHINKYTNPHHPHPHLLYHNYIASILFAEKYHKNIK
jgi:hypothetical protein